jgi:hypothetical protein
MSLLPLIQRPCPYLDRLEAVMDGDHCRMCKRDVHDLTAMNDRERTAFLTACGGDACIRYTFNAKPALAAALIAASVAVAVVPAAAAPRNHPSSRVPRPPRIEPIPMMTAGLPPPMPMPVVVDPPRPPEPPVADPETPPANPK